MARPIRVFDGVFGRLQLLEATSGEAPQAVAAPRIVVKHAGSDLGFSADGEALRLTRENLLFFNPGATSQAQPDAGAQAPQLVVFEASADWLRGRFPAVFDAGDRKSTRLNSSHIQKSRMPSSA